MSGSDSVNKRGLCWWPAALTLLVAGGVLLWTRGKTDWSFQERNLQSLSVVLGTLAILLLWWLTVSRAPWRWRLWTCGGVVGGVVLTGTLFRFHGVSGDLRPIFELRWTHSVPLLTGAGLTDSSSPTNRVGGLDFPQFLGPDRTGVLASPVLEPDWSAHPPLLRWRQKVGSAWSGWAIVGARAFTQEQTPEGEGSSAYDVFTGQRLWTHVEPVRYYTPIAGEGPRCTPTVCSNRVFTLGATGLLNCLDLVSGKQLWSRNIVEDAKSRVPEWGFAGSPLVFEGKVIVSAGGTPDHSLLAYRVETGELLWAGGSQWVSYGSPFLAELCQVRQILAFNSRKITSHDPSNGKLLWEYPWGNGQPQVAVPVIISTNQVVFSSGYGVGSELLKIDRNPEGRLSASRRWQSRKMKAKFANLVPRGGFLYGLDDGVLSCLDLQDGSQRWKEGRYGHGQGLLIRDLLLLMAENGELVLLRPTPEAPNELHRFRVFSGKTWNPVALAGNLLLVRNDREAACLEVPSQVALASAGQARAAHWAPDPP